MCVPLCRRSYETDGGDIYQIKPILRAGLTSGGGKGAWVERVCVPSVRSLYHPHTRSSSYAFWTGREPHACAWLRHRARRSTARASTCRSEASRAVVRVVRTAVRLPTSDPHAAPVETTTDWTTRAPPTADRLQAISTRRRREQGLTVTLDAHSHCVYSERAVTVP